MIDEPMTSGEVAQEGDVSYTAVRQWAKTGKIPFQRTRQGLMLFSRRAVETFLADRARARNLKRRTA